MRPVFSMAAAIAVVAALGAQAPVLRITSPVPDLLVSGPTLLQVAPLPELKTVTFTVDGRQVCVVEQPPFRCTWQAGDVVRGHLVRVVATLTTGRRLVASVRTKDPGFTEKVRSEAVLVPVIVMDHGNFVRGLKQSDFQIFEDGVLQRIASTASEETPLDLVLALDVSGSMQDALPAVKVAVKQLMTKLRPGDGATLVGFNETMFLLTEREQDQRARERAVDLLSSWGGTALYDATVRSLDLVSKDWTRKGLVLFSDGDDRDSLTSRDRALARVQASDAMIYSVGFGQGLTVGALRDSLDSYARATGGRAFFPRATKELDTIFTQIVTELSNQYMLSYSSTNLKQDGAWRAIKVQVRNHKYEIRARRGYRASGPQRASR